MQKNRTYDVAGISSPLLDLVVQVSDDDLAQIGLAKGEMHLVDEARSKQVMDAIQGRQLTIAPGGSAANTLAGVSTLGGRSVLMGTIGNDANGQTYKSKTEDDGVTAHLSTDAQAATGNAITLITPDGERTFATHLGAALQFKKDHVREEDIAGSSILHIEGYYFEDPSQREAAVYAMSIARKYGTMTSIDLSDPGLVARAFDTLHSIIPDYADIVFANELEAKAYTGKDGEEAAHALAEQCDIAVVKLGEHGSIIKAAGSVYTISKHATEVKNTNGAGDMYAAGFLYGLTHDLSYAQAGDLGSFAAACVVGSGGARLDEDLKEKVKHYSIELINA